MNIEERNIGERITFKKTGDDLEVIITQKVERWKESLLMAWLGAWLFCGIYFIAELVSTDDSGLKTFLYICLAFWSFFLFRIGKVFLWRLIGKERITISGSQLSIQNLIGSMGKKERFNLVTIKKFGLTKYDEKSFLQFMDQSFWIIGGDKIGFNYGNKKIRLGKQLSEKDSIALVRVLDKYIQVNLRKS